MFGQRETGMRLLPSDIFNGHLDGHLRFGTGIKPLDSPCEGMD